MEDRIAEYVLAYYGFPVMVYAKGTLAMLTNKGPEYLNIQTSQGMDPIDKLAPVIREDDDRSTVELWMIESFPLNQGAVGQRCVNLSLKMIKGCEKPEVSRTSTLTSIDRQTASLDLYPSSHRLISTLCNQTNSFRLFDLNKLRTWNYNDDDQLEQVRWVDGQGYSLMVGWTDSTHYGKREYKIAIYGEHCQQESSNRITYPTSVAMEWITTIDRMVWIIFSNKDLLVMDLNKTVTNGQKVIQNKDLKPANRYTLASLPMKIEVHHQSHKVVMSHKNSVVVYDSRANPLYTLPVEERFDTIDFTQVESTSDIIVLLTSTSPISMKAGTRFRLTLLTLTSSAVSVTPLTLSAHSTSLLTDLTLLTLPNLRGGIFLCDDRGQILHVGVEQKASGKETQQMSLSMKLCRGPAIDPKCHLLVEGP